MGFVDLGLIILEKRLTGDQFYRMGDHFWWLIPVGVCSLLLIPAVAIAAISALSRGRVPVGVAVGVLSFIGYLDLTARLPLELWASLLLSGGLAVQSARLAGRHREPFLRLVHRTTPWLAGALAVTVLLTFAARARLEYGAQAALPPPPPNARNVLLIVWDTVRATNLGLHGYNRRTSPNLERLAGTGVRFDRAFATAPWTLPSHSSLFTGRWPHELTADWQARLDETYPTLAEFLADRGYDTAGFVSNLDYCSRECGVARGFGHYEDYPIGIWDTLTRYTGLGSRIDYLAPASVLNRQLKKYKGESFDIIPPSKEHAKDAASVIRSFLDWHSWQRRRNRPFFAFLNLNDAHAPYEVPDRSVPGFGLRPRSYLDRLTMKNWETLDKRQVPYVYVQMATDVYDDSIAYLDRRLGLLLDDLARREVLDDTLVIVTADHGEHLGDHALFFHGCSLYRQLVGVPLVIANPKAIPAGRVVTQSVTLRDLPATVVDLLGLAQGAPFPGRSLARLWAGDDRALASSSEPMLMEVGRPLSLINQGREPVSRGPMKALVAEEVHYIRNGDGVEELYDLSTDPAERTNLISRFQFADLIERFRFTLSKMLKKR
jgi:arylsulfatase A-like enzyme